MPFVIKQPKCYPRAWAGSEAKLKAKPSSAPQKIGYVGATFGDLSRWSARFRLAKSFKGIDTGDEYLTMDTPSHYGSIMRMFLVFSAFEHYARCLGIKSHDETRLKQMQDDAGQARVIADIRHYNPDYSFFVFVKNHLDEPRMIARMQGFIDGKETNVSFLGRSARHIFAHGHMSAGSGGVDDMTMDIISSSICNLLLETMDVDFEKRSVRL